MGVGRCAGSLCLGVNVRMMAGMKGRCGKGMCLRRGGVLHAIWEEVCNAAGVPWPRQE